METFLFSLQLVAPVFLIIFLGVFLKRIKIIDDKFSSVSSKLVFNVALPVFIFLKIALFDFRTSFDIKQILVVLICTLISFLIIWAVAKMKKLQPKQKGVFIQGAFRGNFAIIGLAIISNYFGDAVLVKAAILLAVIVPVYNVLALIALIANNGSGGRLEISGLIKEIVKNPLIIGIVAAVPFSIFKLQIPEVITTTGNYLAALTLPLALLGIGGTMDFTKLRKASGNAVVSSFFKIIFFPAVFTFISYEAGYTGEELGMMFILFACPTAIVSFIMASALGGDEKLASNIIVITTLVSVLTIPLGVYLLSYLGLVSM